MYTDGDTVGPLALGLMGSFFCLDRGQLLCWLLLSLFSFFSVLSQSPSISSALHPF